MEVAEAREGGHKQGRKGTAADRHDLDGFMVRMWGPNCGLHW